MLAFIALAMPASICGRSAGKSRACPKNPRSSVNSWNESRRELLFFDDTPYGRPQHLSDAQRRYTVASAPSARGSMVHEPENWTPLSMKISGARSVPDTFAGTYSSMLS